MTPSRAEIADALIDSSLHMIEYDERERAVTAQFAAIRQDPDNPRAHLALAESLLSRDEYGPGFREHEWRTRMEPVSRQWPDLDSLPWNGMHLPPTARLVVIADQGYGDTLMFSRFLTSVRYRCSELWFGVSPEMERLYAAQLAPHINVFTDWSHAPGHAAHCRLSSLPLLLGTTSERIPPPVDLYPLAEPPNDWREVISTPLAMRRVGICWRGREENDEHRARSFPIREMLGCFGAFRPLPGKRFRFIPLQKDIGPAEEVMFNPGAIDRVDGLRDWHDTARVVACLDLVITSDTAIAHLAATLAIPTWILLKKRADWRWGIERADCPWYPSVRLFRQRTPGRWGPVIDEVTQALSDLTP
jgi:hypothetical protein